MSDFEPHTDAELVTAFRAGDQTAFAGIYDRYADRVYTYCLTMLRDPNGASDASHDAFLTAAGRLDQLKDPEKLRPWLFAIARNEVRAKGRHRARATSGKEEPETRVDEGDLATGVQRDELRALVWQAVDGLGERDQELMALHLTEGLEGADLAEAMGVEMSHLDVLVSRMKGRVEKALGAVLIARLGSDDCDELQRVLGDWGGRFDPEVRARVTQHIGGCVICQERRAFLIAPANVLPEIMVVAAPARLRREILVDVARGEQPPPAPTPVRIGGELSDGAKLGIFALVTLMVGLLGIGVSAQFEPIQGPENAPPVAEGSTTTTAPGSTTTTIGIGTTAPRAETTQPAVPGTIEVSTDAIDFGDEATTGQFEISNTGGQPIEFAVEPSVETIVLSAGGEELGAGDTVTYDVVLDREGVIEGEIQESITVTWDGGSVAIAVTGIHMDNPVLHNPQASPAQVEVSGSPDCPNTRTTISVRVRDRSPLETVVVRWSPDGGSNQETPMTEVGDDIFEAEIGPFTTVQTASARVVATDELGNAGGASIDVPVVACP